MPKRIQLSRKKGWRMPENTVKVDRTTRYGNPCREPSRAESVQAFRICLERDGQFVLGRRDRRTITTIIDIKRELADKDLACWCPLVDKDGNSVPCHATVLLEIANRKG